MKKKLLFCTVLINNKNNKLLFVWLLTTMVGIGIENEGKFKHRFSGDFLYFMASDCMQLTLQRGFAKFILSS